MRRAAATSIDDRLPVAALRRGLADGPVSIVICFGSQASDDRHSRSDIDIAVEFEEIRPGADDYNDAYFGVLRTLESILETDDTDLVDVHSASPGLARSIFENGVLVYGEPDRAEALASQLCTEPERSPRERIDDALERIDQHLA